MVMKSSRRILVIDDNGAVLERLQRRLTSEGYEVVTTTQTVGAARFLSGCSLAIIDFFMPGIDGGAVVASLRAASENRADAPLFYLYTSDESKAKLFQQYGFDGVFTNKGDDDSLVKQIAAFFRYERLRRLSARR